MAITMMPIKCPECGADLTVENTREYLFCSYCGAKVLLNNENEHIYRTIDEAEIKQAETDRIIKLKQLEMEEKDSISRKTLIIAWVSITAILLLLGIIGFTVDNEGLGMCMLFAMLVGMWGGIGIFGSNKRKHRMMAGSNDVIISASMMNYREASFQSMLLLYKGAGFTNVTAFPLRNLNLLNQFRNGKVEMVTINGSNEFEEGDIFPKNANVVITYHSR